MDVKMKLTADQQALLDGKKGESVAKVMRTLVKYGETFGAEKMVPITGEYGHLVTSFGLSVMKPVYELMDQLIDAGALSGQKFTVDPRPLDPNVPSNFMQNLFFKIMYSKQHDYEEQLKKLGIIDEDSFTCTCYMNEVGNIPKKGDVLSWAESSAVVYANSILGARCNRNSGILELFGSIAGFVPYFGLLTDEGRKATWIVEVRTTKKPEAQILGSAIGMKVMDAVPYVKGLTDFIGTKLNAEATAYLKDFGAATASNGAVGLYHIDKLTPEAVEQGEKLIAKDAKIYIIDDAELERVKASYPCIWKDPDAKPKLCFIGCPHLSAGQLKDWTEKLEAALTESGRQKVTIPTVFTTSPAVKREFDKTPEAKKLPAMGVIVSNICPLMYMNNPQCAKMPVITNSNKLRTYTSSRYYTDADILCKITKGDK
ncbi:MAG: aconitase X [Oscillospiraceae bacterium]